DPDEPRTITDVNGLYIFNNLPATNTAPVIAIPPAGWNGPAPVFHADFSDGTANGFTASGLLHRTQSLGNQPGHSPIYSMYFGQGEDATHPGTYPANAFGSLLSPIIDLTQVSGSLTLTFNELVSIDPMLGNVELSALVDGQLQPLADSALKL